MFNNVLKFIFPFVVSVSALMGYALVCHSGENQQVHSSQLSSVDQDAMAKKMVVTPTSKAMTAEKMANKKMAAKSMPSKNIITKDMKLKKIPDEVMFPEDGIESAVEGLPIKGANGYLARIEMNSPEDVEKALLRAEELYNNGYLSSADEPLAFVLHGPEVQIFFKDKYHEYKSIVDLAARLSAFNVVDIKVCETRMQMLDSTADILPPFVESVPFGPAEVERLVVKEEYVYF